MRRILGVSLVFVGAMLLTGLGVWTGFVAWVWLQDMGGDRDAILIIQPVTCVCMMPSGFLVLVGAVLAFMPGRRDDSFFEG